MTGTTTDNSVAALKAPTIADVETLGRSAFASLPSRFTRLCEGLVIRVEDFPEDEVLEEMECETEYDLLGLFRGVGLTQGEHLAATGDQPNMIWLYRRPILDFWADGEETLSEIITHVLVHEIGHHFGLSDQDIEEIESHGG